MWRMFKKPRNSEDISERKDYLNHLIAEYRATTSFEAKLQVLANLANFAYDPFNYEYLRHGAIDIFLDEIVKGESNSLKFASAGICNLCLDIENKDYILHCNGVKIVSSCLFSEDQDVVLSALTTLMFLVNPTSKAEITTKEITNQIVFLSHNPSRRIQNLAKVFLEDYCKNLQNVS